MIIPNIIAIMVQTEEVFIMIGLKKRNEEQDQILLELCKQLKAQTDN